MAVDATGTPTSPDNIPTYATSADAPSGKGFNAAMAAIQTALSARVNKPSGIVAGEIPVWTGSAWARSSATAVGTVNQFGSNQTVSAANTDLAWFGGTANNATAYVSVGGGTLRSVGAPSAGAATRLTIRNAAGGPVFTIKHNTAGGTGVKLYLRDLGDVVVRGEETYEFIYDSVNSLWVEVNRDVIASVAKVTPVSISNAASGTLINYTVPANTMSGTLSHLRTSATGFFQHNTGAATTSHRFGIALGGTTLIDTGVAGVNALGSSTVFNPWRLNIDIMNNNATNAQYIFAELWMTYITSSATAWTPATGNGISMVSENNSGYTWLRGQYYNTATKDMTTAQAIVLNVTMPVTSASSTMTLTGATIEAL